MYTLKGAMLCLALSSVQLASAQITSPAPYCAAGYDDEILVIPHYISSVKLGTLNNTTGTTQFAAPHYAYYNAVTAPDLVGGTTYTLSVGHNNGTAHYVAAFIDFNKNNDFTDPGERVLHYSNMSGMIPIPATATVTIPVGATGGITRMRVMTFEDDNYLMGGGTVALPCTADATGSFNWGETEDYNVNIVPPVSVPKAGFAASAVTGNTSTVFTLTDTSTNTPTSWMWTFTPASAVYETGSTSASASPKVKFSAAGTYAVKLLVTNSAGKDSVTKTAYIKVTSKAGINEYQPTANSIAVCPNPAKDFINIDAAFTGATVELIDQQGRVLKSYIMTGERNDISFLPSGSYVLRVSDKTGVFTQTIAVER